MNKTKQFHIWIESEMFESLVREAEERKISISELCRQKLRPNHQITKIELMLERIEERLNFKASRQSR